MKPRLIFIFIVVSTLLCLIATSGPATSAPVKKEVVISATVDLSGPASSSSGPAFKGMFHYTRWINENKGGINGHPIKFLFSDTRFSSSITKTLYRRWCDQGTLVNFTYGTMESLTTSEVATQENRAIVTHGTLPKPFRENWNLFSLFCTYAEQVPVMVKYLVDNWKGTGIPKVQLIIWPNVSGRGYIEGVEWMKKNIKCDLLEIIETTYPVTDFTSYLLEARHRGANLVVFAVDATNFGMALRDAAKQGFLGMMTLATGSCVMPTPEAIAVCGDEVAKGVPGVFTNASIYDDSVPENAAIREAQMKYQGSLSDDVNYVNGWGVGMVGCEAVRRAMNKVGFDKLTPAAVTEALKQMKNVQTNGLFRPISYSEKRRIGQRSLQIGVYEGNNQWKRVTPWIDAPYSVQGITE